MTRELKFRARKDGRFIYFMVGYLAFYDEGTEQQYTGLKDKNGVEIYEGDILCDALLPNFSNQVVEWEPSGAAFQVRNGSSRSYLHNHNGTLFESWEVIGNIYENPELLGKSEV